VSALLIVAVICLIICPISHLFPMSLLLFIILEIYQSSNRLNISVSCSCVIMSKPFTPSGHLTLSDIKDGYLTCPSSPAQSKSMNLIPSTVSGTTIFGGQRSPNTDPFSCNSSSALLTSLCTFCFLSSFIYPFPTTRVCL